MRLPPELIREIAFFAGPSTYPAMLTLTKEIFENLQSIRDWMAHWVLRLSGRAIKKDGQIWYGCDLKSGMMYYMVGRIVAELYYFGKVIFTEYCNPWKSTHTSSSITLSNNKYIIIVSLEHITLGVSVGSRRHRYIRFPHSGNCDKIIDEWIFQNTGMKFGVYSTSAQFKKDKLGFM